MPTYGYECVSCDNQFEIFQSIKDDALTICTDCGGKLRKRIYPVGISFKGSGFYVNDYAAKPAGGSSASGGESAAPAASSEAGSEPSKPEPKTEAASAAKSEPKAESKPEAKAPAASAAT